MGVRGLTTYISNHSDKYLEQHKLHDCLAVIDGWSLAFQLFSLWTSNNSSLGGDYDRYACCLRMFFTLMQTSNVTPIVVLDGGYEQRKMAVVWDRVNGRVKAAKKLNPKNQLSFHMFPLLMKEVFKEVMREMNVTFAQCNFEADYEIAALARSLRCPVLSCDSDFFVYDVLYIPISTIVPVAEEEIDETGKCTKYVNCQIYRVEKFLNDFGGLQKSVLPLIATLLGNDYINRSVFKKLFSHISIPKNHSMSETQKKLVGLLQWLRRETVETAIPKILNHMKKKQRQQLMLTIEENIKVYTKCTSDLLSCLDIPNSKINAEIPVGTSVEFSIDCLNISDGSDAKSEDEEEICDESASETVSKSGSEANMSDSEGEDEDSEDSASENEEVCLNVNKMSETDVMQLDGKPLPSWFMKKYRNGNFPSMFIDIINRRSCFLAPQAECYSYATSHKISFTILQVLYSLLLPHDLAKSRQLEYVTRGSGGLEKFRVNTIDRLPVFGKLPLLDALNDVPIHNKQLLLFEVLQVSDSDQEFLDKLPDEWKLYLACVLFWCRNAELNITNCHVITVLLCVIALSVVDCHAGIHRTRRNFSKKVKEKFLEIEQSRQDQKCQSTKTNLLDKSINEAVENVTGEDCKMLSYAFVPFYHMDQMLIHNMKKFHRIFVHSFAQLQSCVEHAMYLNALLDYPLAQCKVSRLFSGTFTYNMMTNLSQEPNVNSYLDSFFKCGPSVYALYKILEQQIICQCPDLEVIKISRRRQKRKKKEEKQSTVKEKKSEENVTKPKKHKQKEIVQDTNNRFSLLQLITSSDTSDSGSLYVANVD